MIENLINVLTFVHCISQKEKVGTKAFMGEAKSAQIY